MLTMSSYTEAMASDKTSYHHGDLRAALLAAVGELIREGGIGAVSLRAAARRAGVSHAAPAHHFGDKLGMLNAFTIEGFTEFGSQMEAARVAATTPFEAMNAIGRIYLEFAVAEPAWFDVMFRSELHDKDDPQVREAAFAAFGVLTRSVGDLVATGEVGDVDPQVLAIAAWSRVHGMATLWRDGAMQMFVDLPLEEIAVKVFAIPTVFPEN